MAEDIVFATGGKAGTYFAISKGVVRAVKKDYPGLNFLILNTEGAIENARLIDTDACDIALVQNDVAYYYKIGKEIFKFPSNKMQGIASLYTEPIQIIVRKDSEIKELRDLRGKVIAVGPKESGTEFNAKIFLNAIGINYEDIEEKFLSISQAKDSFINNEIDAMFITAGLPTPAIIEIAKKKEIDFLQINVELIKEIRKHYPFFVSTFIPANTYPNQYIEIPTLGVRTLLVAHHELNPDLVRNITQAIFKEKDILESAHPIGKSINLKETLEGMTIPIHLGAREYYVEEKILEVKFIDYLIRIVPLLAIVAVILLLIAKFFYVIKYSFKRHIVVRIIFILGGVYVVGTIGLYLCEHKVNESFGSLGTSFWSVLVYILSGFEGRAPITTVGKAIAIYIFIIGLAILGLITGKIASVFVMEKLKGGKMPKEIKGHIVICNWNNRGDRVIKE
ncbi:MAG: TAXI family TRAP transporter solute-binding subunit, partial [Methanosarcinales archaeon]